MAHGLHIGELARVTGVGAKAIRYYEHVGVLPPPARSPAGYRRYGQRDVERLRLVRRARELGLPLRHLTALSAALGAPEQPAMRPQLRDLVGEQLTVVRRRIAELTRLQRELEQVLRGLRNGSCPPEGGSCRCLETAGARVLRPARR